MTDGSDNSALLRLAVELSPGILAVDRDGDVQLVNRETERLFGYSREEMVGLPLDRLVPPRFRDGHPGYRDGFFAAPSTRRMGSGRDLYGLRKDGSEVPIEIGLNPVTIGDQTLVLASVVDISERKRAEARFQAAVELSPSGVLMTDASGRILLVNREVVRLFGYARDKLIGMHIEALIPERFRRQHPQHRAGFFTDPRARRMGSGRDLYGLCADGTEVPIEIGLTPIPTDEGVVVLCAIVDIRARLEAESRLRHSQKMEAIGTLAGGIAHDFNNILMSIVGHTELTLSFASGLTSEQREDLQQVQRAAERGRLLVERMLTLGRNRAVERARVNLAHAVSEVLRLLRASLPSTIAIHEHYEANTPEVLSDETELHQVVMNLATNAAHAMHDGGVLEVALEPFVVEERAGEHPGEGAGGLAPGLYARLSVRDTGEGMDAEVRGRAFEPFFTTRAPGEGSGLGLSVVHGIVQSHHGAVSIDSGRGAGTRVDIYLPAHPGERQRLSEPTADARPHVLLVEDEEVLLRMLTRTLQSLGYRVTAHGSSLEALTTFRQHPTAFDVLVTDNTMPGMTGIELARRVVGARAGFPVLLISGLAITVDPEEVRSAGVTQMLPKPHRIEQLADALSSVLRSSGKPLD